MLAEALFDGEHKKNILSFSSSSHIKSLSPWTSHDIDLSERFTERQQAAPAPTWSFSTTPVRKLDAPRMIDDFYLHLLDWSRDGFLAVGTCVIGYNPADHVLQLSNKRCTCGNRARA